MKYLVIVFTFLSFAAEAQQNIIGLNISANKNEFTSFQKILNDSSHEGKGSLSIGLSFQHKLYKKTSVLTGLAYSGNKIGVSSIYEGDKIYYFEQRIKLISIPIVLKYDINKYFFINSGVLIDWEIDRSRSSFNSASGLGAMFGLGVQYSFDKFYFSLNPHFRMHSLVPFKDDIYNYHLMEAGAGLMSGYRF